MIILLFEVLLVNDPSELKNPAKTLILEVGLVIFWSSGFIGGVLASETTSIFLVLFWRFLITSLVLLPFVIPAIACASIQSLSRQALIGALAMFGYLATVLGAIDYGVPAGTAALIAALQPLATAALAGAFLNERVLNRQWLGLMVGFLGVAIAVDSIVAVAFTLGTDGDSHGFISAAGTAGWEVAARKYSQFCLCGTLVYSVINPWGVWVVLVMSGAHLSHSGV